MSFFYFIILSFYSLINNTHYPFLLLYIRSLFLIPSSVPPLPPPLPPLFLHLPSPPPLSPRLTLGRWRPQTMLPHLWHGIFPPTGGGWWHLRCVSSACGWSEGHAGTRSRALVVFVVCREWDVVHSGQSVERRALPRSVGKTFNSLACSSLFPGGAFWAKGIESDPTSATHRCTLMSFGTEEK